MARLTESEKQLTLFSSRASILTKVFFERPPAGWNQSHLRWIAYNISAVIRRTLSYTNHQEKHLLQALRKNGDKPLVVSSAPLVSIIIPTYSRSQLLLSRSIPSILNQTHSNIELIVVGDHCIDNTADLLKDYPDGRLKFIDLPQRGNYPNNPFLRWFVAGCQPMNFGLKISKGMWIGSLDDDDELYPHAIEQMLKFATENDLEMVYSKVDSETNDGRWLTLGSQDLEMGFCRSATLYRSYLKAFPYDINSWKKREAADINLWRRMKRTGVRIGFLNEIVGRHYKEQTSITQKRKN